MDVVDSNWCQGGICEIIQHHPFPTTTHKLEEYFVYTGVGYYNEKWEPYNPNLVRYWNPINNNDIRNGRVYEIKRDPNNPSMKYSHWIITDKVFNDLGYDWGKVKNDIFSRISLFMSIPGENIVFKNGILIEKNDGTIYEMRNGEKRGFTSWQSYLDHGYNANTPRIKVSDTEANAVPAGLVMGYKFLKTSTSPNVYLVQGNEKKYISGDAFSFWGFNSADVKTISQTEMDLYINKGNLYRTKYGTIIGRDISEIGAKQYFVSIDSNGKQSIKVTYDLRRLCALGNDASAIIFDQNDWRFVSLSNYGENCKDGEQTQTIALSDFEGLDPSAELTGSFHTRFWNDESFAVDIKRVRFNSAS